MNEADLESFETVCDSVLNVSTIDEYLELSGELYRDYGVDPVFAPYVINGIDTSDAGAIVIMPFESPSDQDLEYLSFGGTDAQSTANEFTTLLIELGMDPDEAAGHGRAARQRQRGEFRLLRRGLRDRFRGQGFLCSGQQ